MKKTLIPIIAFCTGAILAAGLSLGLGYRYIRNEVQAIDDYIAMTETFDKKVQTSIAIYDDFAGSDIEKKLRTHLWPDHIMVARKIGTIVERDSQIIPMLRSKDGKPAPLVSIEKKDALWFYYGLLPQYRYLHPLAYRCLVLVAERVQQLMKERGFDVPLKIAVSSGLRPLEYQKKLQGSNVNAVDLSTHSYGVSFDLFWDDYFVAFPGYAGTGISDIIRNRLRNRLGFALGDALRRQFRTILTDSLQQLQDEGRIYAIMERNQHCYHISPSLQECDRYLQELEDRKTAQTK
jgi:hypothetical protein